MTDATHSVLDAPLLRCLLRFTQAFAARAKIGAHDGRRNAGLLHHIEGLSGIDGAQLLAVTNARKAAEFEQVGQAHQLFLVGIPDHRCFVEQHDRTAHFTSRLGKAGRIIAIDTNLSKFELARQFGATECINPKDHDKPIQQVLIEMTGWGIDHTFECIGNVHVMRAALESAHRGWGQSIVIGVAGAGEEISTRPFQLVTGRVWKGSAFGGVKGRTQLPGMVEDAMKGDIDLAPFVTHTMGLEEINKAFELMHEGKSIRSVIHY